MQNRSGTGSRSFSRLAVVLAACTTMLSALFGVSSAAVAQASATGLATGLTASVPSAPLGPSASLSSHPGAGAAQASRFTVVSPAITITCTINIQYPHKSTHVPGTVNVVGTITCTAPVSDLVINVGLYRSGVLVGSSGPIGNAGLPAIQANAATPCVSGTYMGGAVGGVVFPPGFIPPSGSFPEIFSPPIPITC